MEFSFACIWTLHKWNPMYFYVWLLLLNTVGEINIWCSCSCHHCIVFHYMNILTIYPFSVGGLWGWFHFGDIMTLAAMDILMHVSWSTCALGIEFWGCFTIIQRPAEHLKELEIYVAHWREKIKGEDGCLPCSKVLQEGKVKSTHCWSHWVEAMPRAVALNLSFTIEPLGEL